MMRTKDAIHQELAIEQARLAELERAREEARAKIELLRSELTAAQRTTSRSLSLSFGVQCKAPDSPAEKVSLFRSLFRGRLDVFPTRFVSKKTGTPGYAPACTNKWEPGLCLLKSGGKCGDCANQAFIPVDDQVVTDHLKGRHVIGCYPLLEDETCWFLAIAFDGYDPRFCGSYSVDRSKRDLKRGHRCCASRDQVVRPRIRQSFASSASFAGR